MARRSDQFRPSLIAIFTASKVVIKVTLYIEISHYWYELELRTKYTTTVMDVNVKVAVECDDMRERGGIRAAIIVVVGSR